MLILNNKTKSISKFLFLWRNLPILSLRWIISKSCICGKATSTLAPLINGKCIWFSLLAKIFNIEEFLIALRKFKNNKTFLIDVPYYTYIDQHGWYYYNEP